MNRSERTQPESCAVARFATLVAVEKEKLSVKSSQGPMKANVYVAWLHQRDVTRG